MTLITTRLDLELVWEIDPPVGGEEDWRGYASLLHAFLGGEAISTRHLVNLLGVDTVNRLADSALADWKEGRVDW